MNFVKFLMAPFFIEYLRSILLQTDSLFSDSIYKSSHWELSGKKVFCGVFLPENLKYLAFSPLGEPLCPHKKKKKSRILGN